jgi:hypothetical protein
MTVKEWHDFVALQVMNLAEAAKRINRVLPRLEPGGSLVQAMVRQDLEQLRDDLQDNAEMGLDLLRRQQEPPAAAN